MEGNDIYEADFILHFSDEAENGQKKNLCYAFSRNFLFLKLILSKMAQHEAVLFPKCQNEYILG